MKILSWSHHSLLHLLFNYPCLISNRSDHFRPVILHLPVLSVLLPLANYLMPHLPAHLPLITPLPHYPQYIYACPLALVLCQVIFCASVVQPSVSVCLPALLVIPCLFMNCCLPAFAP